MSSSITSSRNIFLNNLDSLDDDFKYKITLLFATCYQMIVKSDTKFVTAAAKKSKDKLPQLTELTKSQINKFKPMATCFCYEVFINFGKFKIPDAPSGKSAALSGITHDQIDSFCDRIVAAYALVSMSISTKLVPSHLSEETLVAQMNESTVKLDDKVDDFDKEIKEEETDTATAPPPPPAPSGGGGGGSATVPKSKFSMVFNSVVASCRLLKHRMFGGSGGGGGGGAGSNEDPEFKGGSKIRMKGGAPPTCNFHYQLPLYILLFQLHQTLSNENFKESSDFELTLQYYDFLLKMKDALNISSTNPEDACAIGLGIRDLFFINNVVSKDCQISKLPSVLKDLPSKMTSLSGLLTTEFCGALNEEYFKDVSVREKTLTNSVFTDFITSIDIPSCFKTPYDLIMDEIDYKEFVNEVSQSASEVAQQIVADRAREREREQMISASNLKTDEIVLKEEGKRDVDSSNVRKKGGNVGKYPQNVSTLTAAEMQIINPVSSGPQPSSIGGRKTRRRKRTRKPKKSIHKKTRKRRQ